HSQLLAECQDAQNVTFDLSDVNEVDTAGVQLLISLQKQLNSVDGNLLLAGQSEQLLNTLNAFN
ncbi:MAG: STAS domain-containing protein, partial [Gammaproteobacteria bacterium]|nr:STAS domain-containing protein [Gammaproteobacteria bacterium]